MSAFGPITIEEIDAMIAHDPASETLRKWREQTVKRDEFIEKITAERDYHQMLLMHDSQTRGHAFVAMFNDPDVTDDQVRKHLSEWWSSTEAWSADPVQREAMYGLLQRVAPLTVLSDHDERPLRQGKTLTVYRGNLSETPGPWMSSWTLDRKVAESFGRMAIGIRGMILGMGRTDGGEAIPTVWRAKVKRENILGYFDDRGEQEIVTDAALLTGITKIAEARPS